MFTSVALVEICQRVDSNKPVVLDDLGVLWYTAHNLYF